MEGDDGLRQLSEIQFKKGSHRVHVSVTAEDREMDPCDRRLVGKSQMLIEKRTFWVRD